MTTNVGFHVKAAVAALSLLLWACGDSGGQASDSNPDREIPVSPATAVGTWELRYVDAVGQAYLNILELKRDGSYATHMQDATPSDHGRYVLDGGVIGFQSTVDPRLSQNIRFALTDPATLRLTLNTPVPSHVDWKRSYLSPLFNVAEVDGQQIPKDLPRLMMSALKARAMTWQADALPTWVEIKQQKNGRAAITLYFYSPGSGQALRLAITPFQVMARTMDGARLPQEPLPPNFIDLSEILKKAKAGSTASELQRADARVYESAGPVWRVSLSGRNGGTYSAVTGDRIEGDVTGYIAQYEKDWAHAGELWRKAMARYAPRSTDSGYEYEEDGYKSEVERVCDSISNATFTFGRCERW